MPPLFRRIPVKRDKFWYFFFFYGNILIHDVQILATFHNQGGVTLDQID